MFITKTPQRKGAEKLNRKGFEFDFYQLHKLLLFLFWFEFFFSFTLKFPCVERSLSS